MEKNRHFFCLSLFCSILSSVYVIVDRYVAFNVDIKLREVWSVLFLSQGDKYVFIIMYCWKSFSPWIIFIVICLFKKNQWCYANCKHRESFCTYFFIFFTENRCLIHSYIIHPKWWFNYEENCFCLFFVLFVK